VSEQVYPLPRREKTRGGGGESSGDHLLNLVDIKISASEDRLMRNLVEKTTSVETQLSKQILAVETKLSEQTTSILQRVDQIKPGASFNQIVGVVASALLGGVAILAFASDRFDSGLSASGIQDRIMEEQTIRDAQQDAKLDEFIRAVQGLGAQNNSEP
jgi:hypothetical protein